MTQTVSLSPKRCLERGGEGVVFGVILGTGVGGGVIIERQILRGRQGISGEWGHIQLEALGEPCYCGRRGCVETEISGPALERHYRALSGAALGLSQITQAAASGDRAAEATLQHLIKQFGRGIAYVINILDPDVVVLGGGVSNIERLYDEGLEEAKRHVFHPRPDIEIRRHALGDSAGVLGAAMLSIPSAV